MVMQLAWGELKIIHCCAYEQTWFMINKLCNSVGYMCSKEISDWDFWFQVIIIRLMDVAVIEGVGLAMVTLQKLKL